MQNFFPLVSHSQPYEWGQIGSDSLVYQLSREAGLITGDNSSKPFAELWMGDHPSLPSYVKFPNGEQTSLHDSITENPERFLGKAYSHFGKKRLPFLFKVLSVRKTLSLQIHPSKEIAKELNQRYPEVYKDDNHKPEISIALSEFEALCNFRPYEEIVQAFEEVEVLRELLGNEVIDKFVNCTQEERRNCLENIMREFFQKDQTQIKDTISKLVAQIAEKQDKGPRDNLVLKLNEQFPYDIGVLLSYFLNYLTIQPGEAFVMDPCEPHAYIHGNCLEGNLLH